MKDNCPRAPALKKVQSTKQTLIIEGDMTSAQNSVSCFSSIQSFRIPSPKHKNMFISRDHFVRLIAYR